MLFLADTLRFVLPAIQFEVTTGSFTQHSQLHPVTRSLFSVVTLQYKSTISTHGVSVLSQATELPLEMAKLLHIQPFLVLLIIQRAKLSYKYDSYCTSGNTVAYLPSVYFRRIYQNNPILRFPVAEEHLQLNELYKMINKTKCNNFCIKTSADTIDHTSSFWCLKMSIYCVF